MQKYIETRSIKAKEQIRIRAKTLSQWTIINKQITSWHKRCRNLYDSNVSFGKKGFSQIIGYETDHKYKLLCLMLPKSTRDFDEIKYIFLLKY